MIKRKPFFIRGNFQLKFILCFTGTLVLCVAATMLIIYSYLYQTLDQAAFSAHVAYTSSGPLVWETIFKINALMASVSVVVGIMMLVFMHHYLEKFFASLAMALEQWAKGDFSYRIKSRGFWAAGDFIPHVNQVGSDLLKKAQRAQLCLNEAIQLTEASDETMINALQDIHAQLKQQI